MRVKLHGKDLNKEEKNLFYAAFKTSIVSKRKQWRSIIEVMEHEERKLDQGKGMTINVKFKCINEMKEKIEEEVRALCKEWYIEAKYFLRCASSAESRVFYLNIKADTLRYVAQFETGRAAIKAMGETEKRYKEAMKEA